MRGRVMSLWSVAFLGSTPIGGPSWGSSGRRSGARYALGVGGLAALGAAAFGMVARRRDKGVSDALPAPGPGVASPVATVTAAAQ